MNGIVLVRKDEVNEYRVGDSVIYYRRVTPSELRQIRAVIADRAGKIDDDKLSAELFARCVKGWKKIVLELGTPGDPAANPPVPATEDQMYPDCEAPSAAQIAEFASLFSLQLSAQLRARFAAEGSEGLLGN